MDDSTLPQAPKPGAMARTGTFLKRRTQMTTHASIQLVEDLQASMDVEIAIKTAQAVLAANQTVKNGPPAPTEEEAPTKAVEVVCLSGYIGRILWVPYVYIYKRTYLRIYLYGMVHM